MVLCLLRLTEEHFQFNETANKTVKVYGILSISIATDDGLQHSAVDVKTWGGKNSLIISCQLVASVKYVQIIFLILGFLKGA